LVLFAKKIKPLLPLKNDFQVLNYLKKFVFFEDFGLALILTN
tara:strand:- start:396 stop:521 length:126 start_codon:yes stop_codon:yes gene_type:complete